MNETEKQLAEVLLIKDYLSEIERNFRAMADELFSLELMYRSKLEALKSNKRDADIEALFERMRKEGDEWAK